MNIIFKRSVKSEVNDLGRIQRKAFEGDSKKYGSPKRLEEETDEMIQGKMNQSKRRISYSVYMDGEIIGGACVLDFADETYYIEKIFIDPNHQGEGIGKRLLLHIENDFPQAKKWSLSTEKKKRKNIKFYKSIGYKIVGKSNDFGKCVYYKFEKIIKK